MHIVRKPGLMSILGLVLITLVACGGESTTDSESATNSTSNPPAKDIAQSSPVQATDAPSAPAPQVTLVPTDPETTGSSDIPDNPWGKEIPTGPAPTAPPNPPSDFDKDGDGMYTTEEFDDAIRYRYPEYEWPQNYTLDLNKALDAMSYPEGSRIEAPGEYTFLGLYHQCAWEFALLDAVHENDQHLVDKSLHQLKDIGLTKNPLSRDEVGKEMKRGFYDRAALGDVAPLQQWVDNNCAERKKFLIAPDSDTPAASTIAIPERALSIVEFANRDHGENLR